MQNHAEAFWCPCLGCGRIQKTHLFPEFPCPATKSNFCCFLLHFWVNSSGNRSWGLKKDMGTRPPVPGWGWGCLCSLGLGAKFNQTGSRRTSKHRNLAPPDAAPALCGVFLRPHPSSCSEVGRKMGIESSGHLQAALGESPNLSPSPSPSSVERGR